MKRSVPLLLTFVSGFILIVAYFVPGMGNLSDVANVHFDILAAIAFILGGGNLLRNHGERIYKLQRGWGYSAVTVVCFLAMLSAGLFKIGVTPKQGAHGIARAGDQVAYASLEITDNRKLTVLVEEATPKDVLKVRLNGKEIGELTVSDEGTGVFSPIYEPSKGTASQPAPNAFLKDAKPGDKVAVGKLPEIELAGFNHLTGNYEQDGSFFNWLFAYGFKPLQQAMFAVLAFYVASAAYRAFRARNVESVLLLGTAFIILLGRTFLGTLLTAPLPHEGFWSFFDIPKLTGWIMSVMNTAGNRAIMIGVALGVAGTSLKVLLGIDRSYLGSE